MRKTLGFATLLVLATLLGGCGGLPSRPLIEDPETVRRMAEAAPRPGRIRARPPGSSSLLMAEVPRVIDPAIDREMTRIMNRLRANLPMPNFPPIEVVVTASSAYGAELTLDNQIHIPLGMIARHAEEDHLAFALAHEIAHRVLGHRDERQQTLLSSREAIRFGTQAVIYGTAVSVGQQRLRTGDDRGNVIVGAVMTAPVLDALAAEITDAAFSRQQETEADLLGFDLMTRARYDPAAIGEVFSMLEGTERDRDARVANLRGTASQALTAMALMGGQEMGRQSGVVTQWLGAFVAPSLERGINEMLRPLAARYDSLGIRRRALVEYQDKFPPTVEPAKEQRNPFREGALGTRITERLRVLDVLARAEAALRNKDLNEAQQLVRDRGAVIHGGARRQLILAGIAIEQNNGTAVRTALQAAQSAPDATASTYLAIATMYEQRGDLAGALNALAVGERRFGADDPFIVQRASLLRRTGRNAELQTVMATCRAKGIAELETLCADAGRPVTGRS
ncbi:M48 family metalloprotease [Falsiroseomonas sp.]|uniref:M48 family metalloprotease n=1 Tax=Falsiroseomonas sp. TaxID=2870721 RepID=UPI003F71539F